MSGARRIATVVQLGLAVLVAYVLYVFCSTLFSEMATGPPTRVGGRLSGPCEVLATGDVVVYDAATGDELAVGIMDRPWLSTRTADGRCAVVFDVFPVEQRERYEVVVAGTWSASVGLAEAAGAGLTLRPVVPLMEAEGGSGVREE